MEAHWVFQPDQMSLVRDGTRGLETLRELLIHVEGRIRMLTVDATFHVLQNWMQSHAFNMRLSLGDERCRQNAKNPIYGLAILYAPGYRQELRYKP